MIPLLNAFVDSLKIRILLPMLMIMSTLEIKPNYSELARIHECDRRTVKKYDEGYEGKPEHRNKNSRLDKYKKK